MLKRQKLERLAKAAKSLTATAKSWIDSEDFGVCREDYGDQYFQSTLALIDLATNVAELPQTIPDGPNHSDVQIYQYHEDQITTTYLEHIAELWEGQIFDMEGVKEIDFACFKFREIKRAILDKDYDSLGEV